MINFKRSAILLLFPLSVLADDTPCKYGHKMSGTYTKEIQKIENIQRLISQEFDSYKKCTISLDATIDGVEYPTEGSFSFGPDMSENQACGHAEQRAKENIIKQVSPEVFSSRSDMDCKNYKDQSAVATNTEGNRLGNYQKGKIIPISELNPYTVNSVPYIYYSPYPVQQEVKVYKNEESSVLDILRFGAAILPFVGN
jgi:hypothetical protein